MRAAYERVYAELQRQATTLAYVDLFQILAIISVAAVSLSLLLRTPHEATRETG
jgi:hypothetical protein